MKPYDPMNPPPRNPNADRWYYVLMGAGYLIVIILALVFGRY